MSVLNKLEQMSQKEKELSTLSKNEIAELLNTTPEALAAFEKTYKKEIIENPNIPENFFKINAKQATKLNKKNINKDGIILDLTERIVSELLSQTTSYIYDGKDGFYHSFNIDIRNPVTLEEILSVPEDLRPQLSGNLIKKDIEGDSCVSLLQNWKEYKTNKNPKIRQMNYHMFRQGLDILDLDPITYKMIEMNPNSIGFWLPELVEAAKCQNFFKISKTTVIKVPITLLQLTRIDYQNLTPATIKILDEYCMKAFDLDINEEYFIKTGTYSSKFDFRNAYVKGEKEVRELGEYLMFIHFQALQMASPLSTPCIYGVSTTNEWVVREFIKDKENSPSIYMGLPLHTEYRVFVDFDTDEILGISPYWEPETMKKRFGNSCDSNDPDKIHDYIIYQMHEETLMKRYQDYKSTVLTQIENLIPNINLPGQWSIDIMQNGEDFYIIDMALAVNSALNEYIPKGKLTQRNENWIPEIK